MPLTLGRRIKKIARLGLALAIGAGLAAVIGEIVVRRCIPEPVLPRFVVDAGYGVRDNAGDVDTVHSTPGEYRVAIRTNGAGLRGRREYSVQKPPGTYRVALLGDSFVFGFGVEDDEVVSERLGAQLATARAEQGASVEVLNFGVAGFGQAEEYVTYEHKVRAYSPDLVVLFYFDNDIGNDAVSGLFRLEDTGELTRTGAAYLPGVRAREVLYSLAPVRWLFEHSQLWNLVRNRASGFVQGRLLAREGMEKFNDETEPSAALHRAVFLELLGAIRRDGAQTAVFVIPLRNLRSNFAFTPEELAPHSDVFLDGRDLLAEDDYYTRDGHWRPSGHEKAARALADAVRALPRFAGEDGP